MPKHRKGGDTVIDYSPLWKTMKECGISQYTLINRGIDKHTLDQLRKNQNVTVFTVHLMMYFRLKKKMIHNTVIA